jgi:hypothetical protein
MRVFVELFFLFIYYFLVLVFSFFLCVYIYIYIYTYIRSIGEAGKKKKRHVVLPSCKLYIPLLFSLAKMIE